MHQNLTIQHISKNFAWIQEEKGRRARTQHRQAFPPLSFSGHRPHVHTPLFLWFSSSRSTPLPSFPMAGYPSLISPHCRQPLENTNKSAVQGMVERKGRHAIHCAFWAFLHSFPLLLILSQPSPLLIKNANHHTIQRARKDPNTIGEHHTSLIWLLKK